jgi:hypothetical protein
LLIDRLNLESLLLRHVDSSLILIPIRLLGIYPTNDRYEMALMF